MSPALFSKTRKSPDTPVGVLPDGERVYCIGDIHGRADLLEKMHGLILEDAAGFDGQCTVVYLGDYIDRGDNSKSVLDILVSEPLKGFETVHIKGNHEQALLNFLERPLEAGAWLDYGGREALASYGVPVAYIPLRDDLPALAEQFAGVLPQSHKEFIAACQLYWRHGGYYFVHAGIRPGIPLDKQSPWDHLMIRDDFLFSDKDHGAVVVHGHTITAEPELLSNRIGIDTGAFRSGVLTCVVLEGDEQRIIQAVL